MSTSLGTIIYSAVKPIFKIYFIIGLGYFIAKRNVLSVPTCRDISDMIVTAIMPCLIFVNIVSNLKSSDIKSLGIIFFTGTILFASGAVMAIITYIVTKAPKKWRGGLLSVGLFPNISDLPIAYLQTLSKGNGILTAEQGDKGVAYVCIFLAAQVFYQFSLGFYRLIEWDFKDEIDANANKDMESGNNEDEHSESSGSEKNDEHNVESNEDFESPDSSPLISIPLPHSKLVQDDSSSISSTQLEANLNPQILTDATSHLSARLMLSHEASIDSDTSQQVRSRRMISNQSFGTNKYSLHTSTSRIPELRQQKSQDVEDVIKEYSEFEGLKNHEVQRTVTGMSEVGVQSLEEVAKPKSKFKAMMAQFLKNLCTPNSISLIVSIAIAMSPPLRALFVVGSFHIPPAPDNQPPLSFIIDIAGYIGAASVPLGLLLLGATISRLQIKKMPKGFWKTALMITAVRLIIMPMVGVGITTGFQNAGWYDNDIIIRLVSVISFGLPSATALVYFTAFYTDPKSTDHVQMDCLAVSLIFQYSILFITLPFLVTFTFKVSLGY